MSKITDLSKSKYCKGIQCPKILWLDAYKPEVGENILSENVIANGNLVGDLARSYFRDYYLVDFSYIKTEMTKKTQEFINAGAENIAEAAFLYDGLYCAVDILHKNGDGWDIVEVKSSTHLTEIYVEDMAFQYYLLTKCGLNIKRVFNMHLNGAYVRHGELDLSKLFVMEDCTDVVIAKCDSVDHNIADIRSYVSVTEEPERDIDLYCEKPYECAYRKYCGKHLPENSIFDLAGMFAKTKYKHYHNGIITYEDILDNAKAIKLNSKHRRQVESILYDRPDEINTDNIQAFLNTIRYPVYHLDFETFQHAVPEFDEERPYQQIPFQYSLHIEQVDGSLEHREFLGKEGTDPRRALAEQLVSDIPMGVCSLAYNMSFEKGVIERLAKQFPDLSEHLMDIHDNMHDLMIPFKDQDYYSSAMNGSYSIKYVLPALYPYDPELDYHNLDGVHNGSEASYAFADMPNHTPEEIEEIRQNLLRYCGLDTYAMVKVLRKLREAANE
ncbi:DUF2779 domain-containing protein [Ruminococcus albus]|uniref:DUF2779 domain-containing protein n=1 Tax=Ruminococcus albus TaxID=1264 RepID=A0A1I1D148_RUMAL|nr:DUF2779 domain-containing protein [Ruminococcus albus]SFB66530.1 protein of unknown function [Ruminococcus albus]